MRIFQSEQVMKLRNVLVFVGKNEWPPNSPYLKQFGLSCVGHDAGSLQKYMPKPPNISWRMPCYRYGMICHRSSLIRHSCHFESDFDRLLLQLMDILNTTFSLNTERAADIRHWNVCTVDEKVVQSLIRYYWIFRTRLHVHLKKWTLNLKRMYLSKHTSYFNKICRIYGLNPHLQML